jgi:hypothetical protein
MPRFYFHVKNGFPVRDRNGVVLPDIDAAKAHAAGYAKDMANLELGLAGKMTPGQVVVMDDDGNEVLSVPLPEKTRLFR